MSPFWRIGGLRRNGFGIALIVWTFFVWVGRLRNIIVDEAAFEWSEAWRPLLVATFIGMAVIATVLLFLLLRASTERFDRQHRWYRRSIMVLAGFGIVVWLVRGPDIAFGEHSVGFIVVHSVLAVVTIGLGLGAIWSQRSKRQANSRELGR